MIPPPPFFGFLSCNTFPPPMNVRLDIFGLFMSTLPFWYKRSALLKGRLSQDPVEIYTSWECFWIGFISLFAVKSSYARRSQYMYLLSIPELFSRIWFCKPAFFPTPLTISSSGFTAYSDRRQQTANWSRIWMKITCIFKMRSMHFWRSGSSSRVERV